MTIVIIMTTVNTNVIVHPPNIMANHHTIRRNRSSGGWLVKLVELMMLMLVEPVHTKTFRPNVGVVVASEGIHQVLVKLMSWSVDVWRRGRRRRWRRTIQIIIR
ncbi:hypothetical protein WICPIJ_001489 [Wickerhamomyces pijperi]|uniref:Uncharacterized protein n=1 Tax=Wickerhamomyces pijperi TaxID=599730 RepID=A0A9P8QAP7_WICPI|nr:hypothetical protein WICPIJ_001489 [Wickerhamomyces pijperi]